MYYGTYLMGDDLLTTLREASGSIGQYASAISTGLTAGEAAMEEQESPIFTWVTENPLLATLLGFAIVGGSIAGISWLSSYFGARRGGRR